jgi:hypothetical protein
MTTPDPARPVRDGSRDASPQARQSRRCPICTAPLSSTRARYCSATCKQHALRLRHHVPLERADERRLREELRRPRVIAAHTVYECPLCGERFVGQQRCPECHRFCRAVGIGGHCPECELPILLADVLGTALPRTEVMR